MERPTKEQVDVILAAVDACPAPEECDDDVHHLAAEVRALREELDVLQKRFDMGQQSIKNLDGQVAARNATIAHVWALPNKWREHAWSRSGKHGEYGAGREAQVEVCALDVEAALRGEPCAS